MRRSACLLIALLVFVTVTLCSGCSTQYKPKGRKIPEGFLINCYPGSECTQSDSTPLPGKKTQQIVVLLTTDDVDKVVAWYKTELVLKGYQVISDNNVKGSITLESQNDANHVTVTCSPLGDKNTIISISVFPKPI
jgi:hypothetical protein